MEIIFPMKMGSIRQERPSYPIICVHRGRQTGPQFPGLGCEFVSFTGTPGIRYTGTSILHWGREVQLLQAFLTGCPIRPYVFTLSLHSDV